MNNNNNNNIKYAGYQVYNLGNSIPTTITSLRKELAHLEDVKEEVKNILEGLRKDPNEIYNSGNSTLCHFEDILKCVEDEIREIMGKLYTL